MSELDPLEELHKLNDAMSAEEQAIKDSLDSMSKLIESLMEQYQPAPENKPVEPTVIIVNMETGEEKTITQSELDQMMANATCQISNPII
jgi:hypothetical protein